MLQHKNFSWLLIALLIFLIGVPIADELNLMTTRFMRATMFSWLVAVGVWSLRGFGNYFSAGIVLAVSGILFNVLAANFTPPFYTYASLAAVSGFLLLSIWCTLTQVASDHDVSANRLVGAISLYLMLGVLWAIGYTAIEMISPGSFTGVTTIGPLGWSSDWLYLSFVTMTTLGYGDITPDTPIARVFTYLQALFGQFYVAILVAGLVGAYISGRGRS